MTIQILDYNVLFIKVYDHGSMAWDVHALASTLEGATNYCSAINRTCKVVDRYSHILYTTPDNI